MIQSVFFGEKNTWDDWKLLPVSRPVMSPPTVKTNYIDIPGGNGALDLTEALTGYPVYNNRQGSWQFRVMNDYVQWFDRYSEIMAYLHGRTMNCILEDDKNWLYNGRFAVDGWESQDTWSVITISYNVGPFKWTVLDSLSPWIWDTFNFESGIIYSFDTPIVVNTATNVWVTFTYPGIQFGIAPVSPEFVVTGANNLKVRFINTYLGIDKTMGLTNGTNLLPEFIFYGATTYTLMFTGAGTINLKYRRGAL